MVLYNILGVADEDDWSSIVWDYMGDHPDDYPDPENDFFRASTDLIYRECSSEEDAHLRSLCII